MNTKNKHMNFSHSKIPGILLKTLVVFGLIVMFIQPGSLKAQVINNKNAVISVTTGTAVQGDTIRNTAGTLINEGIINLNGSYINADSTKGNGKYNIKGNWLNTGKFVPGNSTVRFNGNNIQTFTSGGDTLYHLVIDNTSLGLTNKIRLLDNAKVSGKLTMDSGIVETGADTLFLLNPVSDSLKYTSTTGSRVIGKFNRGVNATDKYLFPLGSDDHYNPMNLTFKNVTPGNILSEFVAADPDSIGLPLPDPGFVVSTDTVEVYNADSVGYWSVKAQNGFVSTDYDINIGGSGFSEVQNASRIIKRKAPADDWTLDGDHKDGSDSVAYRNTLDTIKNTGNHFGWGQIRPRIQKQPEDTSICDGNSATFSIVATGRGELTYEWQVLERSGGWKTITDNGIYANSNTDTLFIQFADTSMSGYKYRVIVRDSLNNFHRSNAQARLTVDPRPVVTATPQQDTICNNETTFIDLNSTVTGTTYTLEVLNWATTSITGASTSLAVGDTTIEQTLYNPTLYADSVIYRIFPNGPSPTDCGGTADTVIIWVNPTPVMSVEVADTIVCDSTTLDITVNDELLGVKGTKVYQLTTTNAGGYVLGVQASGEYPAGLDISDNLVNTTNQVQVVTYTFRPRIDDDRNGGIPFCDDGRDTTLTIYVNPTPDFNVAVADTIVCDSSTVTLDVTDLLGNIQGTKVYDLTTIYNAGAVLNVEPSANDIPIATDIVNQLINTTNEVQAVTYYFRYRFNDTRYGDTPFCDHGIDTSITIYVNPTPEFNVAVADTIVCDSSTVNLDVTDLLGNIQGTKVYDLTTTYNAGAVLNVETSATDIPIATDIANQLINTTNEVQAVTYYFRYRFNDPRNGGTPFCDHGIDTSITIYVNPTPRFTIAIADTIVCDSTTITLDITDGLNAVLADKVYDVSTVQSGGITGMQPDGEYIIPNNVVDQLVNTTNQAQWITYNLRYRLNDTRYGGTPFCDHGIDTSITVWVNPTPQVYITVFEDTICNDTRAHITLTTPTVLTSGFVTFDYTSEADAGLTGNSSGNGLIHGDSITDLLHNSSAMPATPLVVRYHVTPQASSVSCVSGPVRTDSVTVHPTADTYMSTDSVRCYLESNGTATVLAENGINDFTYQWDDPLGQTTSTATGLVENVYHVTVTDNQGCTKTDLVNVGQPDLLIPVVDTIKAVSCFGVGDAYIVLAPTGGNGQYFYDWSTGDHGLGVDSISGLDGEIYFVTVTDWKGCYKDTVVEVDEPPQTSVSVNVSHVRCNGEDNGWAEVDAIGVDSYIWSTGATTARINNLKPGPYTVTATNAEGCISITNIEIKEPGVLQFDSIVSTNISCAGDADGTVTLYVSGGNIIDFIHEVPFEDPYNFTWSTDTVATLINDTTYQSGLPGGKYYVTVTDLKNCIAIDSTTVDEPPEYKSSVVSTDVTCFDDMDGTINLTVTGGNTEEPYTYFWDSPTGNGLTNNAEDQSSLSAGPYYVTITDAKDCKLYDSTIISEPDLLEAFLSETNISCNGFDDGTIAVDITGGNGNYSIDWSNGETSDSIYGLSSGTYYVTVTDQKNCVTTNYVEITQPDQIENNPSHKNITCFGDNNGEIVVSPEGGTLPYYYLWSHSSTLYDSIASNLGPGNYSVSVVDDNNCLQTTNIDITQPDEMILTVDKDDISCFGETDGYISLSMFGGTPDYTYTWSNGIYETSANMLPKGEYNIQISDIHDCEIDTSIEIIEPEKLVINPIIRKPTCPDIQNGYIELNITGGRLPYSVYWDDGSSEENLYDIRSGIYDVLIDDSSLCEVDTSFTVRSAHNSCIDIPNAFSPNKDGFNDKWEIDMGGLYPDVVVEVFDRWGNLIFNSTGYEESQYWDGTYNGKELPMDAYYYIIYLRNGTSRLSGTVTIIR